MFAIHRKNKKSTNYIDWKTRTTNIEQETDPSNCLLKSCRLLSRTNC